MLITCMQMTSLEKTSRSCKSWEYTHDIHTIFKFKSQIMVDLTCNLHLNPGRWLICIQFIVGVH